jgi:hypothetical protein
MRFVVEEGELDLDPEYVENFNNNLLAMEEEL